MRSQPSLVGYETLKVIGLVSIMSLCSRCYRPEVKDKEGGGERESEGERKEGRKGGRKGRREERREGEWKEGRKERNVWESLKKRKIGIKIKTENKLSRVHSLRAECLERLCPEEPPSMKWSYLFHERISRAEYIEKCTS